MTKTEILDQLVAMSRRLGAPERDLALLGEGNTSACADEATYFVKASGTQLGTADRDAFVEVRFANVLAMLEAGDLSDAEIGERLNAARADPAATRRPSVETVLHAHLLRLEGIAFVGHTHPVSLLSLLCAHGGRKAISGRIFPDEIVCCGVEPAYVEFTEPGIPLARATRDAVDAYIAQHGFRPKAVLLENHGLFALGATPSEVEAITLMWDKTARVLAGTYTFGGPRYLSARIVDRIIARPDEKYREREICKDEGAG
jgi:rhamnose utilization protein RhaD (predicted bifunctional aldolase and dehydrogenase)